MLTKLPYFDQYINKDSPKYLIDNNVDYSLEEYQYENQHKYHSGPNTNVLNDIAQKDHKIAFLYKNK